MILAGLTGSTSSREHDCQALQHNARPTNPAGAMVTKGWSGRQSEIGRQAALEDREKLLAALEAGHVLRHAGMAAHRNGRAPIIADLARQRRRAHGWGVTQASCSRERR